MIDAPTDAAARFAEFVAPARARAEPWRLALGLAAVAATWLTVTLLLAALLAGAGPRIAILAYLTGFAGMILGLELALRLLHRRSLRSVVGPGGFRPREFLLGVAVVAAVSGLAELAALLAVRPSQAQPLATWAVWVPFVLGALFVQVTAEELVFRGYLQQQLAARFARRAVWWGLPAVMFGALHWQPGYGANAWLLAATAAVTGLVYGDVTTRLGNLSASIGLHFANNAFAALILPPPGPLGAFGLLASAGATPGTTAIRDALALNIAVTLLVWGVWRAGLAWRARA